MELNCPHCHTKNRLPAERIADEPKCGHCKNSFFSVPVSVGAEGLGQCIQQHHVPVIVDFWAPWCGPCRSFAPLFKAAAQQYHQRLLFVKVDTEAHPSLGGQYVIRSIPTLAAFSKGKEVERISGALPKAELDKWIHRLIGM